MTVYNPPPSALPAGSGTELQARLNSTTFQAITGSSWDGTTLTLPQTYTSGTTYFNPFSVTIGKNGGGGQEDGALYSYYGSPAGFLNVETKTFLGTTYNNGGMAAISSTLQPYGGGSNQFEFTATGWDMNGTMTAGAFRDSSGNYVRLSDSTYPLTLQVSGGYYTGLTVTSSNGLDITSGLLSHTGGDFLIEGANLKLDSVGGGLYIQTAGGSGGTTYFGGDVDLQGYPLVNAGIGYPGLWTNGNKIYGATYPSTSGAYIDISNYTVAIYDTTQTTSADFGIRTLQSATGYTVFDWSGTFNSAAALSYDEATDTFYTNNTTTTFYGGFFTAESGFDVSDPTSGYYLNGIQFATPINSSTAVQGDFKLLNVNDGTLTINAGADSYSSTRLSVPADANDDAATTIGIIGNTEFHPYGLSTSGMGYKWQFGGPVSSIYTLDTVNSIEVIIDGTTYNLALVN